LNSISREKFRQLIEYQKYRLLSQDPTTVKRGLQDLCSIFRCTGINFLTENGRNELELRLLGLLHKKSRDPKILMWTLNALSFVGRSRGCLDAIKACIGQNEENPSLTASGIAALQKIFGQDETRPLTKNLNEQIVMLASLRHLPSSSINLDSSRIDIDKSSPEVLRLALILVGTEKAPPYLFDPHHENNSIIKVLGAHDDAIVRQYSCWAVVENPHLGLTDLGIEFCDIQDHPPNVRAWMYEALCDQAPDSAETIEFIEEGSRDPEARAKAGLSHGLRERYIDGLEPTILDWHSASQDSEINQNLLHHMASFASEATMYEEIVLHSFEHSPVQSEERANLLSAAVGKPLYPKLKKIEAKGDPSLFALSEMMEKEAYNMKNPTQVNFNGPTQVGAFSVEGDASNSGTNTINSIQDFKRAACTALEELDKSNISSANKEALKELLSAARDKPDDSTFELLKNKISELNSIVTAGVSSGEAWAKILYAISQMGLMIG